MVMTMQNEIKEYLINELAKGEFISGQVLATSLNVTRATIAKHIKHLSSMGLDIYSVTG